MLFGDSTTDYRCFCMFDCQCDKMERTVADWTSHEALDTVKNRLLNLTDPTEIFARLACVLFYREILDEKVVRCTRDNLKKVSIAFSYACPVANEEVDCLSFYASCWQRFQQIAMELEQFLCRGRSRRLMPLLYFIEEVFPQDSNVLNVVPPPNSAVSPTLRHISEHRTNESIFEPATNPSFQAHLQVEDSSVSNECEARSDRNAPTHAMPSESAKKRAVKRSASEEGEKKPQTREPMRSIIVDATPVAANVSPAAINILTPPALLENGVAQPKNEPIETSEEVADQSDVPSPTGSMVSQTALAQNLKRFEDRQDGSGQPPENHARAASEIRYRVQKIHCDRIKDEVQARAGFSQQCSPVVTPNPLLNKIDKSTWFRCPKVGCKCQFKFEWMLKRHDANHDRGRRQFPSCKECGMDFKSKKQLSVHVVNMHNPRNLCNRNRYVCEECDFYFKRAVSLSSHKQKVHKKQF